MPIDPQDIERLKSGIDLASYIASRGIGLNKNGKNHKALCPFHQETSPSFTVNPDENLWHCFGCGAGGDIFSFVERLDKVSFTRAVGIVGKGLSNSPRPPLKVRGGDQTSSPSPQPSPLKGEGVIIDARHTKLLNRVVQFYQQELWKDRRGLNYLKQRGIGDKQSLLDFGVGFVSGNLLEILPSDGDYEAALKQIGILNERSHEMFYGCVVFPLLDLNNNVVGLYGRRIDVDQVAHLYLPGPRRGLINRQAAKRSKTLFLTESIIDALSLYVNGFKNVIPLYGVNGWTADHAKLFEQYPPEVVYLCFDNDEAGLAGAYAVKEKIRELYNSPPPPLKLRGGVKVHIVKLPEKDLNDYFRKYRPEEFEQLIKEANPQSLESSETERVSEERFYDRTESGFMVGYGKREYEIKGVAKLGTQLKATIKAGLDIRNGSGRNSTSGAPGTASSASGRFQITTLDFYSLRSREWFAKVVGELTGEREELAREDLKKILTRIENYQPNNATKKEKKVLTREEEREALTFLNSPRLFDEILSDLETLGCTGEETNKLAAYLVAISRKMEEPLALLIRSRSAAGKSTLQDTVLSLVPEEDCIKYTRLTDQALFYKEENSLVHKLLAIEEAAGVGGSAYSIRAIQSSKQLTVATTSKDPATGKMRTEEHTVNGPLALMLTTTSVDLDPEMESRFLTIAIDESKEMTERIHQKQRELETLEGYLAKRKSEVATRKHRNAQRCLKPLAVVNPFAPYLHFPSENLRSRRDHKKYLNLMKAVAFLHQYQRTVKEIKLNHNSPPPPLNLRGGEGGVTTIKYIEVTLEDVAKANKIANEILGKSLDDLSSPGRTLLGLIHQMVKEEARKAGLSLRDFSFNRRTIREYAKWSEWQVRLHIQELEDLGYLYSRVGSHGKEYVYELNHEVPDEPTKKVYLGLTDVSAVAQRAKVDVSQLEKVGVNFEGVKAHFVG